MQEGSFQGSLSQTQSLLLSAIVLWKLNLLKTKTERAGAMTQAVLAIRCGFFSKMKIQKRRNYSYAEKSDAVSINTVNID